MSSLLPLAQATPPPEALKLWLEVFFWLTGGVLCCVMLWRQLTGGGDRQILEVHGRIKRERAELNAEIAALKQEDRLLRERLELEIKDMRQTIDDVPERVIDLLRKTKDLI